VEPGLTGHNRTTSSKTPTKKEPIMGKKFIPEFEEASVAVTTTVKQPRIKNLPPEGTRLICWLGPNVLHGSLVGSFEDKEIEIRLDGEGYGGFRKIQIWFDAGWEIEFDEEVSA